MADVRCAKCGEPWDYYGVRHHVDMDVVEAYRFLRGEGCPICKFGTACTRCGGTGKIACSKCHGAGKVLVKEAVCVWTERSVRMVEPPVLETCPKCGGSGRSEETCPECKGSGKLQVDKEARMQALMDEVEATDEDPLLVFERRRFNI